LLLTDWLLVYCIDRYPVKVELTDSRLSD